MPQGRLTEPEIATQVERIDAVFAPIIRRLATQWYMAIEFGRDPEDPINICRKSVAVEQTGHWHDGEQTP